MDIKLQVVLIIGILIFAELLIHYLIKKKLNLKYCLIWLLAIAAMLVAALCPGIVKWMANMVGIKTTSNFIFVIYGLFMLLIVFSLTGIVSHMNNRIFRLVQNQAILEERIRRLESKAGNEKSVDQADEANSKVDICGLSREESK